MIRIPKAKAALAAKLRRETEAFLAAGGEIQTIPFGVLAQPAGYKRPRPKAAKTNGVPMTVTPQTRTGGHVWRNDSVFTFENSEHNGGPPKP